MKNRVLFSCVLDTMLTFVLASLVTKHIPKTAAQAICDNQQKTCPAKPPIKESYKSGICADGSDDLSIYDMRYGRCVDECRARPACTAVNVYSKIKLCRLNFQTGLTTRICPKHVYSEKATWKQKSVTGCETLKCSSIQKCVKVNGEYICVTSECPNKKFKIENGYFFGNQVTFGQTRRFWCKPGYTLIGSKTTRCQTDGTWSDELPVCSNREEQTMTVSTQQTLASYSLTTSEYKATESELEADKTTEQLGTNTNDDFTTVTERLTQEVGTLEGTTPPTTRETGPFSTSSETPPNTEQAATSEITSNSLQTTQEIITSEITSTFTSFTTTPETSTSEIKSSRLATSDDTTFQLTSSKTTSEEGTPNGCLTDWMYFDGQCYFFHQFALNIVEAEKFCAARYAKVVEPQTRRAIDFLKDTLFHFPAQNWWIGLAFSNDWNFLTPGKEMYTDDWASGEPNMKERENRCAVFRYRDEIKWASENCYAKNSLICEKEPDVRLAD